MSRSRTRPTVPGYQVMEFLGSGARSTIWQVRDRHTNRLYALKLVTKRPGDDERFLAQAINEFTLSRHFNHPSLRRCERMRKRRRLLSLRELHLYMELCEGTDCQSHRPTKVAATVGIFRHVADALAHMHARGFVHADIKPNNIIVATDGTVKIIDFGQSCQMGTIKERIQGTPDFIAPEQVHRRPLDGRTDLFNFGAALYWTLTGQAIPTTLPKHTDSIQLLNDLHVTPPEQLNPEVSSALSKLVMDCIEPEPSRRPASARDVIAKLDLIEYTLSRPNGSPAE